jgi:hypothetical protein
MSHNVPKTSVLYQKTYLESVALVQNAQMKVKGTKFPGWGVFPKRFCRWTNFVLALQPLCIWGMGRQSGHQNMGKKENSPQKKKKTHRSPEIRRR